jgi:hypothetical protein
MYGQLQSNAYAESRWLGVTEGTEKPQFPGGKVSILLSLRHGERSQEAPVDQDVQSVANVGELVAKFVGGHLTDGGKGQPVVTRFQGRYHSVTTFG